MKYFPLFAIFFISFSCSDKQQGSESNQRNAEKQHAENVVKPALQQIIDSSGVLGSVLIYDPQDKIYYSNDFKWADQGRLPASTFKIPNSIIALETGVVEDDSTLFKWDGEKRGLPIWEQDLILRNAFHLSCVPCYQDIARRIGLQRMRAYLDKLNYGGMVFDPTTIDLFWLEGDSKISQYQQIHFLENFYNSALPISQRTENIMKKLMVIEDAGAYQLSGKTGWSIRNSNNNGWFVGYVEKGEKVFFFATNVSPKENLNMDLFPPLRKQITMEALRRLKII